MHSPVPAIFAFTLAFLLLLPGPYGSGSAQQRVPAGSGSAPARIERTINEGWTFNYFPGEDAATGYQQPSVADSTWPVVALPHTWSTYETTRELHPFIRNPSEKDSPYWWHGWGWYRKKFVIGRQHADKKVFIEFDGVMKNCRLWLNGQELGKHNGGYASFYFDATPFLEWDRPNTLAVAVSNRRDDPDRTPPMTAGNFNVYGGIYRDVRLVIKDKLHIPFQGAYQHEGGTFVTTPKVSTAAATVRVRTWVKNEYGEPRACTLRTILADSAGKAITTLEKRATIRPGQLYEFDQMKEISRPVMWSVENPYVYKVFSEVRMDGRVTDRYESPLGVRYFHWDYARKRLYLNGREQHLHGTNRHQEYPWLGDAIPKWMHDQDLRDIRFNLGHNFIRTAHYSQDPYVYELCDRYGIVVCEEVPNIKSIDFSEALQQQMVREMVRRDRNHPSIFFWSVGNETNDAADSGWIREEDSTRIIHARHVQGNSAGNHAPHTDAQMDMENLLRCTVRGWYNEDVKNLAPADNQDTGHEEHQHRMARIEGASQRGRIDMGNGVMWLYADHGADREYTDNPLKHLNPKGWVDAYRVPKYLYYLWQANYAPEPMVFIHPHYWRRQYAGQRKDIVVDSNCDSVELKVNGRSLGTLRPDAANFHTVTFPGVFIEPGTLEAVARRNGKTVTRRLRMAGEPARVVLSASHRRVPARKNEVCVITADVVDAQGVHVYGATHSLTWNVSGPATLAGPARYTSDIDRHEMMEGTMYTDAPVANVIRATGTPGTITVQVSAEGLVSGAITIEALPVVAQAADGITEPALPDHHRLPVAANPDQSAPAASAGEMREATADILIRPFRAAAVPRAVDSLVLLQNPGLDTTSHEYKILTKLFTSHLLHNQGELVADDYNFMVARFNSSRQITRYAETKDFPAPYKSALKAYYASRILENGQEIPFEPEKKRIDRIPPSGKLVWSGPGKPPGSNIISVKERNLDKIMARAYPAFRNLSPARKREVIRFILYINPFPGVTNPAAPDTRGSSYLVPSRQLLFLPDSKYWAQGVDLPD